MQNFLKRPPSFYSLVALMVLIPYRVLGIFNFDLPSRLFTLVLCFIVVLFFVETLIPYFLRTYFFQLFFYNFVSFENYILWLNPYAVLFLSFCIGLDLLYLGIYINDYFFFILFSLFLYTFYCNLRNIFLNPEVEGSTLSVKGEESLLWVDIIHNVSTLSISLFNVPVSNRLDSLKSEKPFPYITKRYVSARTLLHGIRENKDVITFVGIGLSSIGGGILAMDNSIREHKKDEFEREMRRAEIATKRYEIDSHYQMKNHEIDIHYQMKNHEIDRYYDGGFWNWFKPRFKTAQFEKDMVGNTPSNLSSPKFESPTISTEKNLTHNDIPRLEPPSSVWEDGFFSSLYKFFKIFF